jgi:predicted metal-dependent hydrolase
MISRKPNLNAADAPIVWSTVPEFAHIWNGASIVTPYVEHYLNTVISSARRVCDTLGPELTRDLDGFVQQESTHALYHRQFNKRMYEAGFSSLKKFTVRITEELKELQQRRSLAFNLAYCAGFENVAMFTCKYVYERRSEMFKVADPRGANLFLWHLAEEFEHRSVCHDAFRAISGNYFIRIWGLLYSFWHIGKCFDKAAGLALQQHREGMSDEERRESIRREKRIRRHQSRYMLPKLLTLMRPGYSPRHYAVPRAVQRALAYFGSDRPISGTFDVTSDD